MATAKKKSSKMSREKPGKKQRKKSGKKPGKKSVTVVLLTLNGISTIEAVIWRLLEQRVPIKEILVVDSNSTDGTVELIWETLRHAGKENLLHIIRISQSEFHHARTRDFALSKCKTRFAVLLVQDAIPADADWLGGLLAPFSEPSVAASCSRILPYNEAHLLAQRDVLADPSASEMPRVFTQDTVDGCWYQHVSACVRVSAWKKLSFSSAYEASLQGKDDFSPGFGEDRTWARAMCERGKRIAFSPKSVVLHTHDYSLKGVFSRERQDLRLRSRQGLAGRKHLFSAVPHALVSSAHDAKFLFAVDSPARERISAFAKSVPYRMAQALGQWVGTREGSK